MTTLRNRWQEAVGVLSMHGPSAIIAIGIAEVFYKFHSFTLECAAFLVTWWVADQILERPLTGLRRISARLIKPGT